MKKQQQRTEKTRLGIIDAFWSIYGTKPINRITVSDITQLAGVHRSTFYLYFNDIYELLSQAKEELLCQCDLLPVEMNDYDHTDSSVIMEELTAFYNKHLSKLNSLLSENGDPGFIFELKKRMIPIVREKLGIAEDDKEMAILLDYLITAMFSLLTYSYNNLPEEPLEATLHRIHGILSIGILPLIEAHTRDPEIVKFFNRQRANAENMLRDQAVSPL